MKPPTENSKMMMNTTLNYVFSPSISWCNILS